MFFCYYLVYIDRVGGGSLLDFLVLGFRGRDLSFVGRITCRAESS